MSVSFAHHERLAICRVDYHGAIWVEDLEALARFRIEHPRWHGFDHLHVIHPDADVSQLSRATLDRLFFKHQPLFDASKQLVRRRSAWVCRNPAARAALEYWVGDAEKRPRAQAEARLFDRVDAACAWLGLGASEKTLAESGEGFSEIARFNAARAA